MVKKWATHSKRYVFYTSDVMISIFGYYDQSALSIRIKILKINE